ncbi:MOSC domain-containing protein [Roseateles sp. BYS180W]|uniref:MOSC domain-containing protein n=1 Tax=Roseateles rivi TaxID=3299028 RepID=A0ABW7FU81_9BURK
MKILSVNTGAVAELDVGARRLPSAIRKTAREGAVAVGPLGLEGDAQADLRVHGGQHKAVYAYPSEHYAFWNTVRAQARVAAWGEALPFGAMGENLTLQGLLEQELWVGDVLRAGEVELAVSEPRLPCSKFNAVMGFAQAAQLMWDSAWCGVYLAVHRSGHLQAGQTLELRPGPREVNVRELFTSKRKR